MNWSELLTSEIECTYQITKSLLDLVDDDSLDWKPETGTNWMTTGQLLMHITSACGACFKGFVTSDWGMPDGVDISKIPKEEMLLPAEKMPAAKTVIEAKTLLEEDKKLAFEMIKKCSEEKLNSQITTAPWDPNEMILGQRLIDRKSVV